MKVGFHVPLSKGWPRAISYAKELKCETIQVFSHNPRSWNCFSLHRFPVKVELEKENISPLIIHSAYVVNLASSKFGKRSIELLVKEACMGREWGAKYLVIHPGSGPLEVLIRNLEKLPKFLEIEVLIENTSGGKSRRGQNIEELTQIFQRFPSLGFCLDTAHAFQSGYDISSREGVREFFQIIEKFIGLERLKIVHLNDSLTPLGSHIDRHAHLGQGYIGAEGLREVLRYLKERGLEIPLIMETPGIGSFMDEENMKIVKSWLENL